MSTYLMTVWPLAGHYFPNLALAHQLRDDGHEVRFYSGRRACEVIRTEGFECYPFDAINEDAFASVVNGEKDYTYRWQELADQKDRYKRWLVDTLPAQLSDIEKIVERWRPDVIVCDPMMWTPYLVLQETHRIPVAVFVYVPFCLLPSSQVPPLGLGLSPVTSFWSKVRTQTLGSVIHLVTSDIRRGANRIRESRGLPPLGVTVTEWAGSMPLYLVCGTPRFDYGRTDYPQNVKYVGPVLWSKPNHAASMPWLEELPRDLPLVHVTEGTLHHREPKLLRAAVRGLAGTKCFVSIATGTHRDPAELGLAPVPGNIRVDQWVYYPHMLPRASVVVTTGGAGTVLESLMHGVPVVAVPTEWDKPEVARRVAAAGVGLMISPRECTASRLRDAVNTLISQREFRERAQAIATEFRNAGGAYAAGRELEKLAKSIAASP